MSRRGKRIVVGYVVSLSGKRGGPYGNNSSSVEKLLHARRYYNVAIVARVWLPHYRRCGHPNARVLPLVRYEVDAEEERLRDAVVEAADRWWRGSMGFDVWDAVRALREHLEARKS